MVTGGTAGAHAEQTLFSVPMMVRGNRADAERRANFSVQRAQDVSEHLPYGIAYGHGST